MNTPANDFTIERLVRTVCKHVKAFVVSRPQTVLSPYADLPKDNAQVNGNAAPELAVGDNGIEADQLVLVSLKRISVGSWVPCVRLANDKE